MVFKAITREIEDCEEKYKHEKHSLEDPYFNAWAKAIADSHNEEDSDNIFRLFETARELIEKIEKEKSNKLDKSLLDSMYHKIDSVTNGNIWDNMSTLLGLLKELVDNWGIDIVMCVYFAMISVTILASVYIVPYLSIFASLDMSLNLEIVPSLLDKHEGLRGWLWSLKERSLYRLPNKKLNEWRDLACFYKRPTPVGSRWNLQVQMHKLNSLADKVMKKHHGKCHLVDEWTRAMRHCKTEDDVDDIFVIFSKAKDLIEKIEETKSYRLQIEENVLTQMFSRLNTGTTGEITSLVDTMYLLLCKIEDDKIKSDSTTRVYVCMIFITIIGAVYVAPYIRVSSNNLDHNPHTLNTLNYQ
ncbi:hypothetical protein Ciccas_006135 [Cichlidogyrus casuarinus]|uniref:Uncharacterized protein n=1 Tax=Cichlidogyrus casuarinus TaxID=1844966 RepID=A0ABD2Q944_9PLAT